MFSRRLRLPVATLLVIAAGPLYYQYAVSAGTRAIAQRLNSVAIDLKVESLPVASVLDEVRRKLAEKDAFFDSCKFEVQTAESRFLLSMELANVPGDECLKYVAELSASRCSLGPREISIVDHGAPPRDFLARTTDSSVRWFRGAWRSASQRFGPQPPAPLDPFALDHSVP